MEKHFIATIIPNLTELIKNIASGIRKMEWHMELMEPTNGVIPYHSAYKENTGKQVSVVMNANLQSVNEITANRLTYDITKNPPTLCFCDPCILKMY